MPSVVRFKIWGEEAVDDVGSCIVQWNRIDKNNQTGHLCELWAAFRIRLLSNLRDGGKKWGRGAEVDTHYFIWLLWGQFSWNAKYNPARQPVTSPGPSFVWSLILCLELLCQCQSTRQNYTLCQQKVWYVWMSSSILMRDEKVRIQDRMRNFPIKTFLWISQWPRSCGANIIPTAENRI